MLLITDRLMSSRKSASSASASPINGNGTPRTSPRIVSISKSNAPSQPPTIANRFEPIPASRIAAIRPSIAAFTSDTFNELPSGFAVKSAEEYSMVVIGVPRGISSGNNAKAPPLTCVSSVSESPSITRPPEPPATVTRNPAGSVSPATPERLMPADPSTIATPIGPSDASNSISPAIAPAVNATCVPRRVTGSNWYRNGCTPAAETSSPNDKVAAAPADSAIVELPPTSTRFPIPASSKPLRSSRSGNSRATVCSNFKSTRTANEPGVDVSRANVSDPGPSPRADSKTLSNCCKLPALENCDSATRRANRSTSPLRDSVSITMSGSETVTLK